MNIEYKAKQSNKLIWFGVLLFLIGLLTGFISPLTANPRMGLSSHIEGAMNGMLLMILGLIWPKLNLSDKVLKSGYGLALYGTFTNWLTTLLAALWGAGSEMMPIAGGGLQGTQLQEIIINIGLITLSIAMVIVCVILLIGLRKPVEN